MGSSRHVRRDLLPLWTLIIRNTGLRVDILIKLARKLPKVSTPEELILPTSTFPVSTLNTYLTGRCFLTSA